MKSLLKILLLVILVFFVPPAVIFSIIVLISDIIPLGLILDTIYDLFSSDIVTIIGSVCVIISVISWFLWLKLAGKDP